MTSSIEHPQQYSSRTTEEIGMNRQLGYSSPADLIDKYPSFFWNSVSMHLNEGIQYLKITVSGLQWIAQPTSPHPACGARPSPDATSALRNRHLLSSRATTLVVIIPCTGRR